MKTKQTSNTNMYIVLLMLACIIFLVIWNSLIGNDEKMSANVSTNRNLISTERIKENIEYDSNLLDADRMAEIQKDAIMAHDVLYDTFPYRNHVYIYPDDFGGDYIDYNYLYVLVTEESNIDYYKELLSEYNCVKFKYVKHSYNELNDMLEKYADEKNEKYELTGYYVDVVRNQGVIHVFKDDYDNFIKNEDQVEGLLIEKSERDELYSTSLKAGLTIGGAEGSVTLGGGGSYHGLSAFVTCGHGMYNNCSVTYNGSTMGTVIYLNYHTFSYGDFSIIYPNPNYVPTSSYIKTNTLNGSFTSAYTGSPSTGLILTKYGAVSGEGTCQVISTNYTSYTTESITHGLVLAKTLSGYSLNGDSGGFFRSGNTFYGVLHGGATSDIIQYVNFTPYSLIHDAGFNLKTN